MGKYFKKSKLTLMELSPHSSPPLRTRAAKTLALQRLNKSSLSSSSSSSSSSYLQLRSRRLQKPPILRQKLHPDAECCRARLILQSSSEKRSLGLGQSQTGNVWDVEDCSREFGGDNWYGFHEFSYMCVCVCVFVIFVQFSLRFIKMAVFC